MRRSAGAESWLTMNNPIERERATFRLERVRALAGGVFSVPLYAVLQTAGEAGSRASANGDRGPTRPANMPSRFG